MIINLSNFMKKIKYMRYSKQKIISSKSKIIFIRHAESIFNQACENEVERLGIKNLQWAEQEKNQHFLDNVCFNQRYMDCGITKDGIDQCQQLSKLIKQKYQVKLVLVSPLRRALQTCFFIFKDFNIPIIVEPLLAESCRFSCDGLPTFGLLQKKQKFSTFDFGKINEQKLAYSVSKQKIQECQKLLSHVSQVQKAKAIMQMIKNRQLYQNDLELRTRGWQAKLMLREYASKYDSIAVVSHWYMLTTMLSKKFSNQNVNLEYENLGNCQHYETGIEELMKIR